MRKLLIISGCSFTTDNYSSMHHPHMDTGWKKWPELLGEKMDMDVLNLGRSGAGNEYIFSSILDAIIKNKDLRDVYVVAAWSQWQRRDYSKIIGTSQKWTSQHYDYKGDIYYFMEKSLKYYFMLQLICEKYNVPYKQFQMIEPIKDYINDLKNSKVQRVDTKDHLIKYFHNHRYNTLIKKDNFIGWPLFEEIDGYNLQYLITNNKTIKSLQISNADSHPSALGHEKYAEYIYENL